LPADPVRQLAASLAGATGAELELERPAEAEHGDYATNVALQLAGARRRPPRLAHRSFRGAA
jgi:arginyl-tRNA synthetase